MMNRSQISMRGITLKVDTSEKEHIQKVLRAIGELPFDRVLDISITKDEEDMMHIELDVMRDTVLVIK